MSTAQLAILYVVVGTVVALVWLIRDKGGSVKAELILLVPFWPLYAPFLFVADRARSEGWNRLAPTAETLALLDARIEAAKRRLAGIDHQLAQPEFDPAATRSRLAELEGQGARSAAERVQARLQNIQRLCEVRDRFSAELTSIEELAKNVRVQIELVRWTRPTSEGPDDLVVELESRVEGLDILLHGDSALSEVLPAVYDASSYAAEVLCSPCSAGGLGVHSPPDVVRSTTVVAKTPPRH